MSIKHGWVGRYYEDFTIGDIYRHSFGRTVTETDNIWSSCITHNTNQIHFNSDYSAKTFYKRPLMNSCFTLALIDGMSEMDTSLNGRILEWTNVRMPNPLFNGDTVYAESEVIDKTEIDAGQGQGIVKIKTRGVNADGQVIIEYFKRIMVYKMDSAPNTDVFPHVK